MRCDCCHHHVCTCSSKSENYGCFNFLFDLFMIVFTGGLWLIWIFIREMRKS